MRCTCVRKSYGVFVNLKSSGEQQVPGPGTQNATPTTLSLARGTGPSGLLEAKRFPTTHTGNICPRRLFAVLNILALFSFRAPF